MGPCKIQSSWCSDNREQRYSAGPYSWYLTRRESQSRQQILRHEAEIDLQVALRMKTGDVRNEEVIDDKINRMWPSVDPSLGRVKLLPLDAIGFNASSGTRKACKDPPWVAVPRAQLRCVDRCARHHPQFDTNHQACNSQAVANNAPRRSPLVVMAEAAAEGQTTGSQINPLLRQRMLNRAATFSEGALPPLRRRSSTMSDYSDTRQSFRSSSDFHRPDANDMGKLASNNGPSIWHSAPLVFLILPAIGGVLFHNGGAVVTDIFFVVLASMFLNWCVMAPW